MGTWGISCYNCLFPQQEHCFDTDTTSSLHKNIKFKVNITLITIKIILKRRQTARWIKYMLVAGVDQTQNPESDLNALSSFQNLPFRIK